jgi:hypothetical protein
MTTHQPTPPTLAVRLPLTPAAFFAFLVIGIGVFAIFLSGADDSNSPSSPLPAQVLSVPGPAPLSEAEFISSAYAIHEAYMDALVGPNPAVVSAPGTDDLTEAEWLASAYEIHEAYMTALFGENKPVVSVGGVVPISEAELLEIERAMHDALYAPHEA